MRFARHTHALLTSLEVGRGIKIKQFEELAKTSPQNAPKDLVGSVDQTALLIHCPAVEPNQKVPDQRPTHSRLPHLESAHFWQPMHLSVRPSHAAHEEYR